MVLRLSCMMVAGALAFGAAPAAGFCIFNKIENFRGDAGIAGEVIRGAEWAAEIGQGGDGCCDWQDPRCNPTGRREAKLVFGIRSLDGGRDAPQSCVIEGEAGGWIYVTVERVRSHRGPVARLKCAAFKYKR